MLPQLFRNASAALFLTVAVSASVDAQGRVFVNHDEWTLSASGRANAGAANVTAFTRNVTSWLTGGTSGSVLIASNNFGFPLTEISNDLNSGGYNFTTTQNITPALWASRATYDALFVDVTSAAFLLDAQFQADLTSYVLGGGSVFANLGTGVGGSAAEAARMNGFIGAFGFQAATTYNLATGNLNTAGYDAQSPFGAAIFSNVDQLYASNGNNLSIGGTLTGGYTAQLFGNALFGASARVRVQPDPGTGASVPEPATSLLMMFGFAGLAMIARRRRIA